MKKHLFLLPIFFLFVLSSTQSQDILLLKTSGKVVIGDTSLISTPGPYNLYVQNGILTEKVKVALRDASEWSDDAFESTPSLTEVDLSIKNNKHLPQIPSAKELVKEGYELKDMDAKLLAQIEWLWQHTIQLDNENKKLKQELELIKKKLDL
ncbi:MAG: hypothetical protein P1U56_11370 [Saprospiraceae bacterium]|nr:hypothetical protein [Saprospiraceae bacterium]